METQRPEGAAADAEVADRVLPETPSKALATIRGRIKLNIRVTVDPSGAVSDASLDTPDASKYFANQALGAARKWKFKPAQDGGQAVSGAWVLQFEFMQTGIDVTAVKAGR